MWRGWSLQLTTKTGSHQLSLGRVAADDGEGERMGKERKKDGRG